MIGRDGLATMYRDSDGGERVGFRWSVELSARVRVAVCGEPFAGQVAAVSEGR
jgi:hypothetical protein